MLDLVVVEVEQLYNLELLLHWHRHKFHFYLSCRIHIELVVVGVELPGN